MKTNLDYLFKTNKNLESEGIWHEVSDGVSFKIKRLGGANAVHIKKVFATHHKPYARQIEKGLLDEDKSLEIMARVFVEACLVDWKGIEIDGQEAKFDKDLAVDFLKSLPELLDSLFEYAQDSDNYREDLGN